MNSAAQDQGWREHSIKVENIGKRVFATDGVADRVQGMIERLHQKLRAMLNMRGPDPDYAESDFERGLRAGTRLPGPNYGGVTQNGSSKLIAWILGLFGAASTLLLGLMLQAQYSLRADVSELKGQVSILVQDRSRGNNNGRSP